MSTLKESMNNILLKSLEYPPSYQEFVQFFKTGRIPYIA